MTIGEKNLKDLSYKELATKMAVVLTQRAKPELMTCYEVVAKRAVSLYRTARDINARR